MFVPPYQLLLEELRPTGPSPLQGDNVVVPRAMFELMLRLLVEQMPFDEESYLARNPDVAAAVAAGQIESPHTHFVSKGYFEGRVGGAPMVDAAWYRRRYADVAKELAGGGIASAADHYVDNGAREWRSPTLADQKLVDEWKRAASASAANEAVPPTPLPDEYLRALKRRP